MIPAIIIFMLRTVASIARRVGWLVGWSVGLQKIFQNKFCREAVKKKRAKLQTLAEPL